MLFCAALVPPPALLVAHTVVLYVGVIRVLSINEKLSPIHNGRSIVKACRQSKGNLSQTTKRDRPSAERRGETAVASRWGPQL